MVRERAHFAVITHAVDVGVAPDRESHKLRSIQNTIAVIIQRVSSLTDDRTTSLATRKFAT